MSGITGIFSFNGAAQQYETAFKQSLASIATRGNQSQKTCALEKCALGEQSFTASLPQNCPEERYHVVFDGEFYNFQSYADELHINTTQPEDEQKLETLRKLYDRHSHDIVKKIDGFFAIAIYDTQNHTLFIARDFVGGKPLFFAKTSDFFCFASELNAVLSYPVPRTLNQTALFCYLQLQYVPAPETMIAEVQKLEAGHFVYVTQHTVEKKQFHNILERPPQTTLSYGEAKTQFENLFETAVQKRIEQTPKLGGFLSGGIDSSVVCGVAARSVKHLPTFSIGFAENAYFDETKYALQMAKRIGSEHTSIQVSPGECADYISKILDTFDEPFADSSAIAMYIVSEKVKQHCNVALSGDGADELFFGYRKHAAHLRLLTPSVSNSVLKLMRPLLQTLPQSRNSKLFDAFRKANRYAQALSLSNAEAYWKLCTLQTEAQAQTFMKGNYDAETYAHIKNHYCAQLNGDISLNDISRADQYLVLTCDMTTKSDRMSVRHGLDVRTPFLDYSMIAFANSLPEDYKIHNGVRKRIVKDVYASFFPADLLNRPKHGFEVPLHTWCNGILREQIDTLLSKQTIEEQHVFNWEHIAQLRAKLQSKNPGDSATQIWALLSFQTWWKKFMC
ncbi:MAG: asparagine synthase (glutamine-hydrolyzing) [Bacteroidales bacterium]|jgi:asparagine synthase (glutamine-hydrolysing)|nr:asparagine synthase (glutamine-hydrolyzing) [Bacteroidales bacterium]